MVGELSIKEAREIVEKRLSKTKWWQILQRRKLKKILEFLDFLEATTEDVKFSLKNNEDFVEVLERTMFKEEV